MLHMLSSQMVLVIVYLLASSCSCAVASGRRLPLLGLAAIAFWPLGCMQSYII